jgi:glycosyltransferase involved in cell wall biosynthesis
VAISVLIPVKGKAIYLEQALKSIEQSSLLPNETLVIDDGIDETTIEEIKNKFQNINLKIIKNYGFGLVDALNTGINISQNEYLVRLDSDDLMESNRLQIQSIYLENNPDVAVVGSQVTYIDVTNNILGYSKYPNGDLNLDPNFLKKCLLAHPSVMMRKSILMKVNGYRETVRLGKISLCEDFDLWRRLYRQGKIVNLPDRLTKYRQHSAQLSNVNSSAQTLATFIISSGYFDGKKNIIEISTKNGSIEKITKSEILNGLKPYNKIIFIGRAFTLQNSKNTNYLFSCISKWVNKITNLLSKFN